MPLVIHPRVRKGLCRLATMTAFGVLASTGVAMACPAPSGLTQPFASLGDTSSYFAVPGGSFDGPSARGWQLHNASVNPSTDPITGTHGSKALTIDGGGSAVSPPFCVDSTMPSFRFFARHASDGGPLKVQIRWVTEHLGFGASDAALLTTSSADWNLSPVLPLSSVLNLVAGSSSVQLRFSVQGPAGSWQIDDVYVDPYSFG